MDAATKHQQGPICIDEPEQKAMEGTHDGLGPTVLSATVFVPCFCVLHQWVKNLTHVHKDTWPMAVMLRHSLGNCNSRRIG